MSNKTFAPIIARLCMSALLSAQLARGATLNFQLLTWNDTNATAELPSAVGRKPSATMPTTGDWLVFTADDALLAAGNNPAGAASHNIVDITGAGGPGYNLAPSLSGTLSLQLDSVSGSNWSAAVTALAYTGQANAVQAMNQFLVTPGSPATTNGLADVVLDDSLSFQAGEFEQYLLEQIVPLHESVTNVHAIVEVSPGALPAVTAS